MRIALLLIPLIGLSGCYGYTRTDRNGVLTQGRYPTGSTGSVERWTYMQRNCEVGNRKKQRRCPMGYPGDQPQPEGGSNSL